MKYIWTAILFFFSALSFAGPCNYPDDRDSAGRRCGKRAASVRPGGRLGGDGTYNNARVRPPVQRDTASQQEQEEPPSDSDWFVE